MATTIKTRIKNKINTQNKWGSELSGYVLLSGELAVAKTPDNFKIKVGDGQSEYHELPYYSEAVNIAESAYMQLVNAGNVDPDIVYIVSSDCINAYNQRIKNLSYGIESNDAVNLKQLDEHIETCVKRDYEGHISMSADGGLSNVSINNDNFIQCVLSAIQMMDNDQITALKEKLGLNATQ